MSDINDRPEDNEEEELIDLSFLEDELSKLPEAPPEEVNPDGMPSVDAIFGAIGIDTSLPIEDAMKQAAEQLKGSNLPPEVQERILQTLADKLEGGEDYARKVRNFAKSAALAAMLDGSPAFNQFMATLGHKYQNWLTKNLPDESGDYARIPKCGCQIAEDGLHTMDKDDESPESVADHEAYAKERERFRRATKRAMRSAVAAAIMTFAMGEGSSLFGDEFDSEDEL